MSARIAPSLLSCDFSRLAEQIREAEDGGADAIHIDVMDGHFVPNITLGPVIVEACRRSTRLHLDVHLMIERPERYLEQFAAAGADCLTVHAEATPHVHRSLQIINGLGLSTGLAINPLTPLEHFRSALPMIDRALLMTVNPGFGGQAFIEGSLDRLEKLRRWRDELHPQCEIEVDGGINTETAARAVRSGADLLVAGSAVFGGAGTVAENIAALREAAERR